MTSSDKPIVQLTVKDYSLDYNNRLHVLDGESVEFWFNVTGTAPNFVVFKVIFLGFRGSGFWNVYCLAQFTKRIHIYAG